MSLQTRHTRFLVTLWALSLCLSMQADAQTNTPQPSNAMKELESGERPTGMTLDAIMNAAVRNISKRYTLSDAQRDLTDDLMKREVARFLKDHETEVWPVIGDLLRSRLGLVPPGTEDAMRIGKAARPLLEAAEKYIVNANKEWRTILNDEQKKVHDFDMSDMDRQFAEMDENFRKWETGEPGRKLFAESAKGVRQPRKPKKIKNVDPVYRLFDPNPILETLVEEFIKEHGLSKGQVTAARSILEEFKGEANDYKMSKKKELTAVVSERHAALEARDMSGFKKAEAKHKQLLKPIYQLCDAMTDRLEKQLTTVQLQRQAGSSGKTGDATKKKNSADTED